MTNEELRQRLLMMVHAAFYESEDGFGRPKVPQVVDYLIANGVTIRECGEWKEVYQNKQATVYECSKCHHLSLGASDYCICGADMRGVKDEFEERNI